jgi:hypothetical protein
MALTPSVFDVSVNTSPPNGYKQPLPVTLGPNWQPNDLRLLFVTASGSSGNTPITMEMFPDPPTGFTAAYSLNPGFETHGVYYRRLASGDEDTSVAWEKPQGWTHFMVAMVTARGFSPSSNPTGGNLTLSQTGGDTAATTNSVTVPGAGAVLFFAGSVQSPGISAAKWAVSLGVPTGWKHVAATDKSGQDFDEFDTSPAIVVVGKSFTASGSTGSVSFPTSQGGPAFAGLWVHLPAAPEVTMTIGAA